MSFFVIDTDILTLYHHGDPIVARKIHSCVWSELAIAVVTVDEQLTGWYNFLRSARQPKAIAHAYALLSDTVVRLARWRMLPYTEATIARVVHLKALRLNVGHMDLRIAATALENGAIVVTRNRRDFGRIPGLRIEDWSV
jgi:tRNA(fMet)-specific endonuclease VapC